MLRQRICLLKNVDNVCFKQKHLTNIRCFSDIPSGSETPVTASTTTRKAAVNNPVKNYLELSKARLSSLVVFTTGAGFICHGTLPFDFATMASVCVGTSLCAASAGTFNQIFETKRDASMKRTFNRPLPSGKISQNAAIGWGVGTGVLGTSLLLAGCNPVVAAMGAFNIALYGGAYTFSKPITEANTWIGAIVGAIPPVMGWAAASGGSFLAAEPFALASLLFLWQFPHFFSLAWMHREDYARGGFQMVPVNDPTGSRTANLVMKYSMYLTALPIITSITGLTSSMFAVEGCILNGYLLYISKRFQDDRSNSNARKIFLTSLMYLPALLFFYLYHTRMWNQITEDEKTPELTSFKEAKEYMKGLCIHEVIVNSEDVNVSALCPKVATEEVMVNADKTVDEAKKVAITLSHESDKTNL